MLFSWYCKISISYNFFLHSFSIIGSIAYSYIAFTEKEASSYNQMNVPKENGSKKNKQNSTV